MVVIIVHLEMIQWHHDFEHLVMIVYVQVIGL